jgi:hypothetical protein
VVAVLQKDPPGSMSWKQKARQLHTEVQPVFYFVLKHSARAGVHSWWEHVVLGTVLVPFSSSRALFRSSDFWTTHRSPSKTAWEDYSDRTCWLNAVSVPGFGETRKAFHGCDQIDMFTHEMSCGEQLFGLPRKHSSPPASFATVACDF